MTNPSFFNIILVWPIVNVLIAIYRILLLIHIPYALGFSIVFLTIVIRLILYPLTTSQLKASRKMQDLAPHLSKLKEKHGKDAKKLQTETMKLYKEHGVNPAAGCLPVIIQLPIIWGLYSVLAQIVRADPRLVVSEINKIVYFDILKVTGTWNTYFFGLPLGENPAKLLLSVGPLIILVPILTTVFQFLQSKMMFTASTGRDIKNEKKKDDFASAFQSQSLYIFPILIGFFSYTFPLGLSLYWNTFTIFGIIQQYFVSGLGGLEDWVEKVNVLKK